MRWLARTHLSGVTWQSISMLLQLYVQHCPPKKCCSASKILQMPGQTPMFPTFCPNFGPKFPNHIVDNWWERERYIQKKNIYTPKMCGMTNWYMNISSFFPSSGHLFFAPLDWREDPPTQWWAPVLAAESPASEAKAWFFHAEFIGMARKNCDLMGFHGICWKFPKSWVPSIQWMSMLLRKATVLGIHHFLSAPRIW